MPHFKKQDERPEHGAQAGKVLPVIFGAGKRVGKLENQTRQFICIHQRPEHFMDDLRLVLAGSPLVREVLEQLRGEHESGVAGDIGQPPANLPRAQRKRVEGRVHFNHVEELTEILELAESLSGLRRIECPFKNLLYFYLFYYMLHRPLQKNSLSV